MQTVFASLPLVAAFLAVPQFLPQLARVRWAGTTAGVSWSWAALTSVNNAAWLGYFALSGFWTALVPAISATVLSGLLAIVLARRGGGPKRPMLLTSAWAAVLLAAAALSGRTGLGSALAVAFLLQVTPSVWTVFRSRDTAGVSPGTWLLVLVLARVSWTARARCGTGETGLSEKEQVHRARADSRPQPADGRRKVTGVNAQKRTGCLR